MTGAAIVALVAMLGGQQNGGGGFGGGGFQGGNIGKNVEGEVQTFNHILTPGDRGEWPFEAKKGDVVIIKASSDVFDAALEMVDEKDNVIAKNDDIEDGNQAAQILVRFPADGKYRALVKGYKSAAGGKYNLEVRKLKSLDIDFDKPLLANFPEKGSLLLRIPEAKGGTVAFSLYTKGYTQLSLFRANGVNENLSAASGNNCQQAVFEASKQGESYIWFRSYTPKVAFKAVTSITKVMPITISSEGVKSVLKSGYLDIWEIDLKKGETIEVPKLPNIFRVEQEEIKSTDETEANVQALLKLASEKATDKYLAKKNSKLRFSVMSFEERDLPYNLVIKGASNPWPAGDKFSDSLGVGQSKIYSIHAKMGDIIKFKGTSKTFDMVFEMFDTDGYRTGYSDDSDNLDPEVMLTIGKSGVQTIVISSLGNGGSGTFSLSKEVIPVVALSKDKWVDSEINDNSPSRWHISLKKDELYMLRVRSNAIQPTLTINRPNGDYYGAPGYVRGKNEVFVTFRAPEDGEYTITVQASEGLGKYQIKWNSVGD